LQNTPQRPRKHKSVSTPDPELVQRRQHLLEQSKKAERIGELTRAATLLEELLSITEEGDHPNTPSFSSPAAKSSSSSSSSSPNSTHPIASPGTTRTMLERRIEQLRRRAEVRATTRKREAREKKVRAARAKREEILKEQQRLAEEQRRAEVVRVAAQKKRERIRKIAEKRRIAEEKRLAEIARLAEEARIAEEARLAEIARLAEEERIAEEARLAEIARLAEEERIAEEARLAEIARLAEEERIAEEARLVEIARLAEVERIAEEARLVEIARLAEEERLAAELETKRIEEEEKEQQRLKEEQEKVAHDIIEAVIEDATKTLEQNENEGEEKQVEQKMDEVDEVDQVDQDLLRPGLLMLDEDEVDVQVPKEENKEIVELAEAAAKLAIDIKNKGDTVAATVGTATPQAPQAAAATPPTALETTSTPPSSPTTRKSNTNTSSPARTVYLDFCGNSWECLELAAQGKSRKAGGLNIFEVGTVLEANNMSSDGKRKVLNARLRDAMDRLPIEPEGHHTENEQEELSVLTKETLEKQGNQETSKVQKDSESEHSSSSSVPDMVVNFESKASNRSRGLSVEDVLTDRMEEETEVSKNPQPTE
jgi:hypothetical protein